MRAAKSKLFDYPILITGGAGFLGSHMVALCLEKQVDVVVMDNLSNSDLSNLQKLESHFKTTIPYKLYKIEDTQNFDQKLILKKFPEIKPKFILIQNVK